VDEGLKRRPGRAIELLNIKDSELSSAQLVKTSVDARRHGVKFVCSVLLNVSDGCGNALIKKNLPNVSKFLETEQADVKIGTQRLEPPPVVVGFGPAGIFAALTLAKNGYKPLVLERGGCMDERVKAVERYWRGEGLDKTSNLQFGEGGAGTFSDGKLVTRIGDPLCSMVLDEMIKSGAPGDIKTNSKPHVGTDIMRKVVVNLRNEIIKLGGEVRFQSPVTDLDVQKGVLKGLLCSAQAVTAQAAILSLGHSAAEMFEVLERRGACLEAKPFSVGVRIEHLQKTIDKALYKEFAGHPNLPPGEYQLSHRQDGRAAYTFCMCPGGMVTASAADFGQVVTNGMSYRARDKRKANSALVVSVDKNDFARGF
jgi:uncharacterized FAD-dependent dehydrogenase